MSTPNTQKLVCTACNHENETERVYCHNCGEKLDRTLLPKVEELTSDPELAEDRKRIRKMMNPNRLAWTGHIRTFLLIVLAAAVVAAIFLVCQAPENVPLEKTDRMPNQDVGDVWSQLLAAPQPVSTTFAEFDVNYHLKKSIKSSAATLGLKFKRAFASFTPGSVTISAHREIFDQPLFTSVTFKPVVTNGKWSAQITGLHIGRLGIHPAAGVLSKLTTAALGKAFDKEIKQLDRFARIEPGKGTITFVTKPAQ